MTFMFIIILQDSTYLPGLLYVLKKLISSECITTIIPGRLYRTSSNMKSQLLLRFTTSVENTSTGRSKHSDESSVTQKVIARKNSLMQEVITTAVTALIVH